MSYWGGCMLGDKKAIDLNLHMERQSDRPIAPDTRDYTMGIAGKHGAWDFGADRGPMPFNLHFSTIRKDRASLQRTVRALSAHLFDAKGRPRTMKLVFEYETNKYYNVRYSGSLPIERIVGLGRFTLPLTAFDPDAYSIVANDEITWGSELINFTHDYLLGTTGGKKYTITRPQTIVETVNGNLALRPTFIIKGSASSVTFSANGKSFYLPAFSNTEWIIDGELWTATRNGKNALGDMEGEHIELLNGDNDITITGSGMNFTLDIQFRDRYS